MKPILPVLLSLILFAASASAETVYICVGTDSNHIRTLCPTDSTCIIDGWDTPTNAAGCTKPLDSKSAEYQEYLNREQTPEVKDREFKRSFEVDPKDRAWAEVLADRWGMTLDQVLELLKSKRRQ